MVYVLDYLIFLSFCHPDGSVILESPVLPVQEGEAVTLRCRNRTMFSSNLTAEFYKNGLLFGRSATGNMIMHVSKTDEGLYKCHISGAADSPDSWLAVRGEMSFSHVVKVFKKMQKQAGI